MKRVQDKVCIVTGAVLGLGRACALRLAQEGARVALFDMLDAEGEALVAEMKAQGFEAAYWHVDVASEAQVASAIEAAALRFGAVHVLVNNAGISGANKPTHELTEAEWDRVQAVNVKGVFFCTKHAIPHMRRAGHGSIVNLSSIYGLVWRRRRAALPCIEGRGAVDEQDRCDDLRRRRHPRELGAPRLHPHADGGTPPAR